MNIGRLIIRELFPHLKLKDKNLSITKKIYIYSNIIAQLFVVIWVATYLLLPNLYQFTSTYDNIRIHTDKKLDKNTTDIYMKNIVEYLQKDSLYTKEESIKIYFINDSKIYAILNPIEWLPNRNTYGVTQGSKIFIKQVNLDKKLVYADSRKNNSENLNAILIHELLHVYQNKKYGWFYTSFRMSYWVKEGYPIYKSDGFSNFPIKKLLSFLQTHPDVMDNLTIFEKDKLYALMVKHAIENMNKSVDDLHLGKVEYDEVLDSLLKEHNITKEET